MKSLEKIKLLPAREQVASILRKAILSRELIEGEEISLEEIAKKIGVSSMPVREALRILAEDGLVELRPNKRAIVLGIKKETIIDHYETRAILESEAAVKVCEEGKNIEAIKKAYNLSLEAIKENDGEAYNYCNQAFHMSIWEAAGNKKIENILQSLWNGLSQGYKVTKEDYAKISIFEHKQILEAIEERDKEKVKQLMKEHIKRSLNNILTNFENQ